NACNPGLKKPSLNSWADDLDRDKQNPAKPQYWGQKHRGGQRVSSPQAGLRKPCTTRRLPQPRPHSRYRQNLSSIVRFSRAIPKKCHNNAICLIINVRQTRPEGKETTLA